MQVRAYRADKADSSALNIFEISSKKPLGVLGTVLDH
jgi:hypothetical protein